MDLNRIVKIYICIWESFRPKQFLKNFFIFAALLFSRNLFNLPLVFKSILAFVVFCFLSGSVYIINDLVDIKRDKFHPIKSLRPLASGRLNNYHAILASFFLVVISLFMAFNLDFSLFILAIVYLLIQLAYSFFLKHEIILDVFAIASGFVLRVVAGAVAISVDISLWFLICTSLLALFLALSKRRHELLYLNDHDRAEDHRRVLKQYSSYLLDQMIAVTTASIIMSYSLYTTSEETIRKFGTTNLVFTIPFVLYGIFRYLYLIHEENYGGRPEVALFTDKSLMICVIAWALTVGMILYL